jgi:hypothetical protein
MCQLVIVPRVLFWNATHHEGPREGESERYYEVVSGRDGQRQTGANESSRERA